ncbi:hypothetical protein ACQP2P_03320 [Dactylosporangium sp. CA-139114]|uniref:hypothetical protein n=1 Tax=Dactylosporangium sp. CA-139114 TaxID=3239931 RepID=UPI003D95D8F1
MTRTPRLLAAAYLLLSLATLGVAYALRHHANLVNDAVWVRGTIVVLSAAVCNVLAARGDVRRLRIIAIVMMVAITVIVSLPGMFPVWLKLEQVGCGLLLLGVVLTLPRKARLRPGSPR